MDLKTKKNFIENNLLFIASATKEGLPNVTVVDRPIILDDGRLVIADVQMSTCRENLVTNPPCSLMSFDFKNSVGFKMFGKAEYFTGGQEFERVQKKLVGTEYEAKGAIAITIDKVLEVE